MRRPAAVLLGTVLLAVVPWSAASAAAPADLVVRLDDRQVSVPNPYTDPHVTVPNPYTDPHVSVVNPYYDPH